MPGLYIALLVSTIVCLGLIDHRYKLVFFKDYRRAVQTFAVCLGIFVAWDICGIVLGIFFTGTTTFLLGLYLGRDFPIEELFFLCVLVYTPLLISQYLTEERKL